jgi:hypothetical protein
MSIENYFSGNGYNIYEGIEDNTPFTFKKPRIVKDILEGKTFNPENIIDKEDLKKFIFSIKSSFKNEFTLDYHNTTKYVNFLRYAIGLNTKYTLKQKLKHK